MDSRSIISLIKGKAVKRFYRGDDGVKIEFEDGTIFSVEPFFYGGEFSELDVEVITPAQASDDGWVE